MLVKKGNLLTPQTNKHQQIDGWSSFYFLHISVDLHVSKTIRRQSTEENKMGKEKKIRLKLLLQHVVTHFYSCPTQLVLVALS